MLVLFAGIDGGMLILVLVGTPASVACFAVDGQRLQKSSFWCPQQIVLSVDLEDGSRE